MTLLFENERISILGASGLFGSFLIPYLLSLGFKLEETENAHRGPRHRTDMRDQRAAFNELSRISPTIIVNLVGMTNVDQCQAQPHQAYLLNVRVVENIARWATLKKTQCHLIHFSTDQVYDGQGPHIEEQVTLTNFYAYSKYAGELAATQLPSTILRTSFLGKSQTIARNSLSDWLFSALLSSTPIKVFEDVFFSPLHMETLARIVVECIKQKPLGLFNLGSRDGMSKASFAFAFAKHLGLSTKCLTPTPSENVEFLKAYRPKDMRIRCDRFTRAMGITPPTFADEIKLLAKQYESSKPSL